jgi:phosphoglycerate dehydrogenase-like enzyme
VPELLIASQKAAEYRRWVTAADLPGLVLVDAPTPACEIVFGEPALVRGLLPELPALRWVQLTWAGAEALLDPSLRRDYLLTNARGVFGPLMSEYVFTYLLLHERKVLLRYAAQQQGRWEPSITGTLRGKTIGLLGVGTIGAHIAATAKHFSMRVHGYTRRSEACPQVDTYFHGDDLLRFASGLDYLVSVLPGTPATRHIVDAALLRALPAHALLINAGRGSTLDEAALAEALQQGKLAGAVLDVFEQEPLPPDHFFWRTPDLLITSHTAAPSFPQEITALFSENYRRYIRGEPLLHVVDFEEGY